ncbi:MAG TPA: DEAD/DEAH box helicase [Ktedonobacteraceae bacterium]|jgi:ATP-dependent helicase YprA (DUF1998 family)
MNIFDLRRRLIDDYAAYIKSFILIRDQRIQEHVEQKLFREGALWPEPLIQLNPLFEAGETIDELVAGAVLHPACRQIFRREKEREPQGLPLRLHKHQAEAVKLARAGHSYVLTTGTGSGKSLAYMIPIVDYVLRHPAQPGIKAIVVYPMNALANSQLGELEKYLPGPQRPVRFERYTGQENKQKRDEIIAQPPDILLTNYVMLELILTRLRERDLLSATRLRFLVLDELHTYRGRQGADVALLVRRVRDRLTFSGETLQCVGTSATLAGGNDYHRQQQEVAEMATRIFGCEVQPAHVIGESLVRVTRAVDESAPVFRQRLSERVQTFAPADVPDFSAFIDDPLSIWLESTFGVSWQAERLVRAQPRRIAGEEGSAAHLLHTLTGVQQQRCIQVIQQGLLAGYEQVIHPETGRAPFAFRLHQFISKGDTVYATLEHDPPRHVTLQYQRFAPGGRERILLPLAFCRECGQEYYTVRWHDDRCLLGRDVEDQLRYLPDETQQGAAGHSGGVAGFLYIDREGRWPRELDAIAALLPDDWKETRNGKEQLKKFGRDNLPRLLHVRADGTVDETGSEGIASYFLPAPFRFCLFCKTTYSSYIKSDFEKLARLSSEGRSTATTILSLSTIRHLRAARARGEELTIQPKMLSFTDNRQDASLQAGHFNDFVEVGLLRSALYRAIMRAGPSGLRHDQLTQCVLEALGLKFSDYAANAEARYSARVHSEQAMRRVLGYRLYLDLRRGWRITSPNLEQCGLLTIAYEDLPTICADHNVWQPRHEALRAVPPVCRLQLCRVLLDHMRRELAIKVDYLDPARSEELKQQSSQYLIAPWALDEDEDLQYASRLFARKRERGEDRGESYLSGLSSYGRYARRILQRQGQSLKADEIQQVIRDLLAALESVGLVEAVVEARGKGEQAVPGYQLPAATMIWHPGSEKGAYHDPLRMPGLPREQEKRVNPFFARFYRENAEDLEHIQHLQAAEHTAQVPAERRKEREDDFREDRLPILYCSPTMELGVDIAQLNVVNMRNIPPTPANYAQRSGRAGRSGQPALVFAYCSTGSSHDHYFFQHPAEMVSGAVAPARLDLANEDLLRAHVHAIWLAESGLALGESLRDLLDLAGDEPTLVLKEEISYALRDLATRRRAELRASAMLKTLQRELGDERVPWYAPNWLTDVLDNVERSFEHACQRWRGLYRAAQTQRDTQNAIIRDASRAEEDKKQARRLRTEAESQLDLLTASNAFERTEFSEFYSYRYFASEGFLPGYNFPRLPLSAYIPARRARQRDEYLSRPRFLAIAEFAPRAIVYHEGSRYIINRSLLPMREDHSGIVTSAVKQCTHCGYLHPQGNESSLDVCVHCAKPLGRPLTSLFRLQNVSTRRRDKISSDEEERLRQGYDIRTGVRFAPRQDGRQSAFEALVKDQEGHVIARLTYGQAATLWRINFGPARRSDRRVQGFVLDAERGFWGRDDESVSDKDDPMSGKHVRVIPYVEDTRNCLLFEPLEALERSHMASLQAALKSALQVKYQLEDNELAAEPLPDSWTRYSLLFYEATEGGAGVLRQLIDTSQALADVAKKALRLCHFHPVTLEDLRKGERAQDECEAACYQCLLTYANQRDHLLLDRQSIKSFLVSLAACRVTLSEKSEPGLLASAAGNPALAEAEIERRWLAELEAHAWPQPGAAHLTVGACRACPDFIYGELAVYIDGSDQARQARDSALTAHLEDEGQYMVVRFQDPAGWEELFAAYVDMFRRIV